MTRSRTLMITLVSCATLALAGCESDEDKAERYYQAGLTLMEQGDKERAALEFRNVFNHDGFHKDARMRYAQLMLDLDRGTEAYGQYLRLVEQYPDAVDARVALAEMSIAQNNWSEVERHGGAAFELAPDLPKTKAINLALLYRTAVIDDDAEKRAEIAAEAETLLEEIRTDASADNDALVRVVLDNYLQSEQPEKALETVNAALERSPEIEDINLLKAQLLATSGDIEGTGAHLEKMVELFPENIEIKQELVRWYLNQDQADKAETFLRGLAGAQTGPVEGHVTVYQLLQNTQGPQAAQAELELLRDANAGTENGDFYSGMLASIAFEAGQSDKAIADLRAVLENAEDGPQKTRLQVVLARMLIDTGERPDAYTIVDSILEDDPSNVPALQMRASRLIREDKSGDAIVALRTALSQSPGNANTLTLMAQAHERDGDINLMGERLALAVEASDSAAPEALRYAQFLIGQNRPQVAITVLEDARSNNRGDVTLIETLTNLYLRTGNWQQAQIVVQDLRQINTAQSQQAATELEVLILQGQNRAEESLALLQQQFANQDGSDIGNKIRAASMIVQAQIRSGKPDEARVTLDEALAEIPDSPGLRMLSATLYTVAQDMDKAEEIYRDLVAQFPDNELPVRLLINLLGGTGRPEAAREVLTQSLALNPDQPNLLWIEASYLEQESDFDGAIAIYEKLYEGNSASPVVANNLASLITTYRGDPESLTRAANIVRRLRGTNVPAFQDTYGWIAYRRGDFDEALDYLEPASKSLPDEALVQYHLGMTYLALNRAESAKEQLEKALELAGDSPLPQFDEARTALEGLN